MITAARLRRVPAATATIALVLVLLSCGDPMYTSDVNLSPSPSFSDTPTPTPTPTPSDTPMAIAAPPAAPAAPDASNRIRGYFLAGANMPWLNFGSDFGGSSGGVASNTAAVDTKLAAAKAAGMHVVRWWMFEGGSPQIQRDGTGTPTGLNPRVYTDLDAAVAEAARYHISLDLVLFGGTTDDATTHAWWTDPSMRTALRNVLVPLFQRYANQTRILSWEIVNEPDWQIRGGQTDQASATALVNLLADAVHANARQLVTVGQAQLWDMASWAGSHIDFYSPHYYDNFGTTGGGNPFQLPPLTRSPDGKPVVIGEFEAGAGLTPTAAQRYQALYDGGYAGAWMWSLTPEATSDHLPLDGPSVAAFAAGKPDVGPPT